MLKKTFYLFLLVSPLFAGAQQRKTVYNNEKNVLYRNEASGSINLNSGGWGVGFRKGKHLTGDSKRMWEIDATGMSHPKEYKISSIWDNGQSYVFGKKRGFLVIRSGFGFQNVLYNKAEKGGVEIRYIYFGGISWGFTKPIYYEVFIPGKNELIEREFDESLTYGDIYGKASFFKGFNQLTLHPGLYLKGGFSFEYGNKNDALRAIEVGSTVDLYFKEIPIMALIDNKQLFLNFYVMFSWGKKW